MPYKQPGAFARFVQNAGAVNSPGSARTMAIVGTGTLMYDVLNVAIERDADRAISKTAYDVLPHSSVFEVISLTNKQRNNGNFPSGTITWENGTHFEIKDEKYIVWYTDPEQQASVTETVGVGNVDFASYCSSVVNVNKDYLVQDGNWRIEVTYSDAIAGAYRVLNDDTGEVLGEYSASSTPNSDAIPGISLTVTSTYKDNEGVSSIQVGDYVLVQTLAAVVPAEYVELDVTDDPIESTRIALPALGSTFYVSYTYKKPESTLVPKIFYDYDDVVAEYGNYDVTASGKIINSLTLGAEIAFSNGISPVVCVQARNDSDFEIKSSIDKLRKGINGLDNVNTIVPLTTSKSVGAHLLNHVVDMSSTNNGKERMGYLAAVTNELSSASIETAESYANERIVYVAPGGVYKDIRDIRTGKVNERLIDSSYLAVAVAATGLKNDPAEPLTNKNVAGFNRLASSFEESEMNAMAAAGVLLLKQVGSNIKIRHGITTSVADVNSTEITLIQIKDYVIDATRKILADLYIGNKLRPSVVGDVQSSLLSILNQFKSQEVLIGYSNVSVKRSKDDPRQIDVKFEIEAVYPLNYIVIEFGFSSTSN